MSSAWLYPTTFMYVAFGYMIVPPWFKESTKPASPIDKTVKEQALPEVDDNDSYHCIDDGIELFKQEHQL